jgi:hypothetical protein
MVPPTILLILFCISIIGVANLTISDGVISWSSMLVIIPVIAFLKNNA